MKKKIGLLCICLFSIAFSIEGKQDVRIAWNYRTYQEIKSYVVKNDNNAIVKSAHYPRIKRLSGGDLLMLYMDGKFGWNIYARKSKDNGLTWSDAIIVRKSYKDAAKNDNVCYACPDFIELPNGRILVAYQWRYNNGYGDLPNTNKNCGIETIQSLNQGETFIAASAKKAYWGRNWEPSFVLLPTGELQLFCTDSHTLKCNVGLIRSFDYGNTWIPATSSSFTDIEYISRTQEGDRTMDGMAVGQYLDNNNGVAIAIESEGGTQTPWIVWSSNENNWRYPDFQSPMLGPSEDRKWLVHKDFRGFAPYMAKLPTGEIIVQSNGKFKSDASEKMWVFIGNDQAKEFSYASSPFAAWWGSISYIGNEEVISSGNSGYKESGTDYQMLRIKKGLINRSKIIGKGMVDCVSLSSFDRSVNQDWFIGGKSQAQAYVNMKYTEENFNISSHVFDRKLNYYSPLNCDGIQMLIYRKDRLSSLEEIYRLTMNIDGSSKLELQNGGGGFDGISTSEIINTAELEGTLGDNNDVDEGYKLKTIVPWSLIGGIPNENEEFRIHLLHKNNDNSTAVLPVNTEDMSGEASNDPATWLAVTFDGQAGTSINPAEKETWATIVRMDKDHLRIDLENAYESGLLNINVYNHSGMCLVNQSLSEKENIDISHLNEGLYLIKIVDGQGRTMIEKIFK